MHALAGDKVSEDVLRVSWLDYLPVSVQRLLRVFKPSTSLEELSAAADELVDPGATALPSSAAVGFGRAPASHMAAPTSLPAPAQFEPAAELAAIRAALAQLTAAVRDLMERGNQAPQSRRHSSRSRTPGRGPPRARSPSANGSGLYFYHIRWDAGARQCQAPCNFNSQLPAEKLVAPSSVMSTDAGVPPPVENRLHLYDRESHMKFLVDSGSVVSLLPHVAVNKRLSPQKFAVYAAN